MRLGSASRLWRANMRHMPATAAASSSWESFAFAAVRIPTRGFFVQFQDTPNDACCKFFVEGARFLPEAADSTWVFDRENSYQSPLAESLLSNLPMVEEVTVGPAFITVRRVDDMDAEAAARYFAMKFHGTTTLGETEEDAANISADLQEKVNQAIREATDGDEGPTACERRAPSPFRASEDERNAQDPNPLSASTQRPIEPASTTQPIGTEELNRHLEREGNMAQQEQPTPDSEQIDTATLQSLISAMDWSELKFSVSALITDHLFSGKPHIDPSAPHPHADTLPEEGDTELVQMLKELIATVIRPQLQADGGDIRLVRHIESRVEVEMLGACRKCKSSSTTLRDMIERTIRHWIPEVEEVVEVRPNMSAFERFSSELASENSSSSSSSTSPSNNDDSIAGDDKAMRSDADKSDPNIKRNNSNEVVGGIMDAKPASSSPSSPMTAV